ncbi:MAG TPA: LptF/LptG family permease [Chryseosolibacter sp.]
MKKIDKLILTSFLATLSLTFLVVTFILLNRQMLVYYDDIIGKGLGWDVVGRFIGYLTIFIIPQALPLSILLASLMCFGNLGEHFELTAIKSAGISLTRIIQPVFIFVVALTAFAFYFNNMIVPKAALEAFSLLYDIKQTKPTMDIREGTFYNGLPDISIKVNQKFDEDPSALKDILLYDHHEDNKEVYVADSGRMFTILDDRYLKFELFDGYQYKEDWTKTKVEDDDLSKTKFSKIEMVVDLSSFDMTKTDTRSFASHRYMKNLRQLQHDVDSLTRQIDHERKSNGQLLSELHPSSSMMRVDIDSLFGVIADSQAIAGAANKARIVKAMVESKNGFHDELSKQVIGFQVQWNRIIAYSVACVTMLLIGAPLGAIVKKGGIGLPFLIAIIFFIIFFVFDMQGEKLSMRNVLNPYVGMWFGNAFLFVLGCYFLYQARIDGRLFDADQYSMAIDRLKSRGKRLFSYR